MAAIITLGLFVLITITFIGVGMVMVYSWFTGKIVPKPEEDALFQIKFGYRMRGIIGLAAFAVGAILIWGFLATFL